MKNVAIKFAGLRKKCYLCTRKFGVGYISICLTSDLNFGAACSYIG